MRIGFPTPTLRLVPALRTLAGILGSVWLGASDVRAQAPAADLGEALNNPGRRFAVSSLPGVVRPWGADTLVSRDGRMSARSGVIDHQQASAFTATFRGPGTLRFWWKVSSEAGFDWLTVFVDGVAANRISGNRDWALLELPIGEGAHVVDWEYRKDRSVEELPDAAWVDEIAFVPTSEDEDRHIDARVTSTRLAQTAVVTGPGSAQERFLVSVGAVFQRLDEVAAPAATESVPVRIDWELLDVSGAPVRIESGTHDGSVSLATHGGGVLPLPAQAVYSDTFGIPVADPSRIRPDRSYQIRWRLRAFADAAGEVPVDTGTLNPGRLMAFSGRLAAGSAEARFDRISFSSITVRSSGQGYLLTVDTPADAVRLMARPEVRFQLVGQEVFYDPTSGDLGPAPGRPIPLPDFAVGGVTWRSVEMTQLGIRGLPRLALPRGFGWSPSAHGGANDLLLPAKPSGIPLRRRLDFRSSVGLDAGLGIPGGSLEFTNGEPLWVSLEGRPMMFRTSSIRWEAATGEYTFVPDEVIPVRRDAVQALKDAAAAGWIENPADDRSWDKKSNDDYHLSVAGVAGPVRVRSGSDGRAVLAEMDLMLGGGGFAAHYPRGVRVGWSGMSRLRIADGAVDTGVSGLLLARGTELAYLREESGAALATTPCVGLALPGGIRVRVDESADPAWRFSDDGGLLAGGPVTASGTATPADLQWGALAGGQFAFQAGSFTTGRLRIAGHRGTGAGGHVGETGAAALLLAGVGPSGSETPGSEAYAAGLGDYAGLNLRVETGGMQGVHRLAGNPEPVGGPLLARSKYNVRPGGVSGIHELETFERELRLFGFRTRLTALKLAFLDGVTSASRTRGVLAVPPPTDPMATGFELPFSELRFTGRGGLDRAELSDSTPFQLPYWNLPMRALAVSFATTRTPDGCATDTGSLVLSVDARIPTLTTAPLRGTLGFTADGRLVAGGPGTSTDSTLQLPPDIGIHGPSGVSGEPASLYRFVPSTRAMLSRFDPAIPEGFVSVAGMLHCSTLPGARVHLHARAALPGQSPVWSTRAGDVPLSAQAGGVWIMGGWPLDPARPNQHGWQDAQGRHFFNNSRFDPTHRGFPETATLDQYRNPPNAADRNFRVRNRTYLLDVAEFEYSLQWSPATRSFRSSGQETSDLVFLRTEHRMKRLTPTRAELEFGVSLAGDPTASLAALANDFENERNGVYAQVENGVRQVLGGLPGSNEASRLLEALNGVDRLVDDRLDRFIEPYVDLLVDQQASQVVAQLVAAAEGRTEEEFRAAVQRTLLGTGGGAYLQPLRSAVEDMNTSLGRLGDATAQAQELSDGVSKVVADLEDGISSAKRILGTPAREFDPADRRVVTEVFRAVAKATKAQDGQTYEALAAPLLTAADLSLAQYVPEAEQTFRKIDRVLRDLEVQAAELRSGLRNGEEFLGEIQETIGQILGVSDGTVFNQLLGDLNQMAASAGQPRAVFADAATVRETLKRRIQGLVKERLKQSVLLPQLQGVFRRRLGEPRERLTASLDLMFATVEEGIRRFAEPRNLTQARDTVDRIVNAGKLGDAIDAAALKGSATFNGPSITRLRLDADLKLRLPDEMEFRGWFEFEDYGRDGPAKGCIPAGIMAASVRLGASGRANLAGSAVSVSEDGYFSFASGGPAGLYPIAFFGDARFAGSVRVGSIELNDLRLQLAMGVDPSGGGSLADAYLAGNTKVTLDGIVGDVAFFTGRTCRLGELETLDPDILRVLGEAGQAGGIANPNDPLQPFNGFYVRFGGSVNISRMFGIPRALADLSGRRHEGWFAFVRETGGGGAVVRGGALIDYSFRGQLLSSVSLTVNTKAIAYANVPLGTGSLSRDLLGSSLCLSAAAGFEACLVDPICADFSLHLDGEIRPRSPWLALQLDVPLPGVGRFSLPRGHRSDCFR